MQKIFHKVRAYNKSISVSEQVCTYPSPDPRLAITCYQLIVVGWGAVPSTLTLTDIPTLIITKKTSIITNYSTLPDNLPYERICINSTQYKISRGR